jgi:eukaryotic-like serine/threonine-protein kinase
MNHERWRRIEDLYHAARSLTPDARAQFLATACRGDESLRSEVESLIAQPEATWTGPGTPANGSPDEILGKRLGQYDVQSLLGAGGMGRVYRARDTRLGRDVALKLLPPEWAGDPDRLARLEREARLLASLNHPNIATIHGIADGDHAVALVLEFIEGDTLADRLARGPLPPTDALTIARQVTDALDAAHERGIVHRDLKPANIKITPAGLVKVLDFGIATLEAAPDGGTPQASQAPTVTARGTREGVVAGTPAYMSPEQARGLAIDKRTDIWAFGCVLYEMLTGRAAFARATFTDTIAAIVEREPEWNALPRDTPPGVVQLLRRCLEKDRRKRLRDIGDAGAEAADSTLPERGRRWLAPAAVAAAVAVIAVGGASMSWLRRDPPARRMGPIALTMLPPDDQRFVNEPIPSPNGTRLAFVATAPNGRSALWVRALGETKARRLDGTDGATRPFWSADGREIGFAADLRLKRIDVDAATIQTVCACLTGDLLGAAWNSAGLIVFAPHNRSPLHRVAASGGTPEPITVLDLDRNENSHRYPAFLPDGHHVLFTARSDVTRNTGIYLLDTNTGQRQWLFEAQSPARYLPSGHILYVRERTLLAQAFDVKAGTVSGNPLAVANDVDQAPSSANALFAASSEGDVIIHRSRSQQPRQLVAVNRDGTRRAAIGPPELWADMKLSPDGKRAALVKSDDMGNRDIWLMDLPSGRLVRWSAHPATDWRPVWSPDSKSLAFASDRNGASSIFRRSVDGGGSEELVTAAPGPIEGRFPNDWGQNDRLLFNQDSPGGDELWMGALAAGGQFAAFKRGAGYMYGAGRFSPDGRWVAYVSNESGSLEVYLTSMDGSYKQRISTGGGMHPRWNRNGRELLYYAPADNSLMSVPLQSGTSIDAGSPVHLFQTCLDAPPPYYSDGYELADDGTTWWTCPGSQPVPGAVTVSIGWADALNARGR